MMLLDLGPSEREVRNPIRSDRYPTAAGPVAKPAAQPHPDRDPPAEKLAKAVVSAAIATKDAVDAELFNVVRFGLMLSSGRPGVKKLMFVFTDRINPRRKSECFLSTAVSGADFVLVADCLGRTTEVARTAIADPSAADTVRRAVEKFLLQTADHFAAAA